MAGFLLSLEDFWADEAEISDKHGACSFLGSTLGFFMHSEESDADELPICLNLCKFETEFGPGLERGF